MAIELNPTRECEMIECSNLVFEMGSHSVGLWYIILVDRVDFWSKRTLFTIPQQIDAVFQSKVYFTRVFTVEHGIIIGYLYKLLHHAALFCYSTQTHVV